MQSHGLNFNDITQIDEFIEHAQFHSEQYEDNVFVFISKHYGDLKAGHNKEHEEEKEDHEELPFHHRSHISSITVFVVNNLKIELNTPVFTAFSTHTFFYQESLSSLHLEGLFQPPRQS